MGFSPPPLPLPKSMLPNTRVNTRFHREKQEKGIGNMIKNKEIIGLDYLWIRLHFTVYDRQMQKNCTCYKGIFKLKYCKLKQFQVLAVKLQHASLYIPGGKGLLLPLNQ